MLLNRNTLQDVASQANEEARLFSLPEGWEEGREQVEGMTWDDASTMDRDDAHLIERPEGGWDVSISISDMTSFISRGSALARYALLRGETRYLPNGNDPMVPHEISEGRLSLLDTQETPALTLKLHLDEQMQVVDRSFSHTRIRPRRITYAEVNAIAAGHGSPEDIAMVNTYHTFAKQLLQTRRNQGAFVFYDTEGTQTTSDRQYTTKRVGELVVQECAILRNTQVPQFAQENNIPILYRNHHLRSGATLEDIRRLAHLSLEEAIAEVGNVFDRAQYGTVPTGHVGLGVPLYMHDTSPLRRGADMVSQANINAFLRGEPPVYTTEELNEIAEHLNEVHDANRRIYYKAAQRAAVVERLGQNATELLGLTPEARRKILGVIDDVEALPEGVRSLLREMGAQGELDTDYIKMLVFSKHNGGKGWEDVQEAIILQLSKTPFRATHMLRKSVAEGRLREPTTHTRYDPVLMRRECTTDIVFADGTEYTASAFGRTERAAVNHAAALLVAQLAGIEPARFAFATAA